MLDAECLHLEKRARLHGQDIVLHILLTGLLNQDTMLTFSGNFVNLFAVVQC